MIFENLERNTLNGVQTIYRFENNYGASVIKNNFLTTFQLVVIYYESQEDDITYFNICYDTGIANDILYNLSLNNVNDILSCIKKLEHKKIKRKHLIE